MNDIAHGLQSWAYLLATAVMPERAISRPISAAVVRSLSGKFVFQTVKHQQFNVSLRYVKRLHIAQYNLTWHAYMEIIVDCVFSEREKSYFTFYRKGKCSGGKTSGMFWAENVREGNVGIPKPSLPFVHIFPHSAYPLSPFSCGRSLWTVPIMLCCFSWGVIVIGVGCSVILFPVWLFIFWLFKIHQ